MTDDLESIVREIEQQTVGTEHTGLPCEQSGYEHMCEVYVAARMIAEVRRERDVARQTVSALKMAEKMRPAMAALVAVQPTEAEKWMAEATEQLAGALARVRVAEGHRDLAEEELRGVQEMLVASDNRVASLEQQLAEAQKAGEANARLRAAWDDLEGAMHSQRKADIVNRLRGALAADESEEG